MKDFNKIAAIVTIILSLAIPAFSQPVKPHTFSPLDPVSSSKINANFDTIYQWGSVASAAIELHKADTAAHGATGAVVGTTNTQTLTNKTIGTTNSIDGGAIKTGTVADARIDSALARDSEVTSAVSTHAGLTATHGATGAVMGTTNTQTVTNKTLDSTNSVDGGAIKSGTVADARIDAAIARDSEVTSAISTHAGLVNTHGFYSSNSSTPINPDNTTINGLYYCNSVSLFGQTDGALYSQAYSSAWQGQIYQDYRTGQLALRGKNNGAWQAWRTVRDSSNFVAGTAAANYCAGNDSRLSDARTPTAHGHSGEEVTSGTIADARLPSTAARKAYVALSGTITAGWYRIAQCSSNGSALFNIYDGSSGNHSGTLLWAGVNYNARGTLATLGRNFYNTNGVVLKSRLLRKTTYDPQYLEIYVENDSTYVVFHMYCNDSAWSLITPAYQASVPSGYIVTAQLDWDSYSNSVISVSGADTTNSIHICRDGNIYGIGGTFWRSNNDGSGSGLDADLLEGYHAVTANTASTIPVRDGSGDITTRLFRSTYAEQTTAPATTADIAFRNDTSDNYIRFMDAAAFKAWLINSKIGVVQTSAPASPVDGDIWVE